jgi:hypothetical protein
MGRPRVYEFSLLSFFTIMINAIRGSSRTRSNHRLGGLRLSFQLSDWVDPILIESINGSQKRGESERVVSPTRVGRLAVVVVIVVVSAHVVIALIPSIPWATVVIVAWIGRVASVSLVARVSCVRWVGWVSWVGGIAGCCV